MKSRCDAGWRILFALCVILGWGSIAESAVQIKRERYERGWRPVERAAVSDRAQRHRHHAGDAYHNGREERRLDRYTGRLALRLPQNQTGAEAWARLTARGNALGGYSLRGASAGGILLLQAEQSADASSPSDAAAVLKRLRDDPAVVSANPVFADPGTGLFLVPTEEMIVALNEGVDARDYFGDQWPSVQPLSGAERQYVLRLAGRTAEAVLAEVTQRTRDARVAWAEPNFIGELRRQSLPNDPFFGDQWHLRNTGQGGGRAGADLRAPEAWELGVEGEGVVIAVVDDGVETSHPDLMPNIFRNEGDPVDGVDNDQNGFVDDVNGWNFVGSNNAPEPDDVLDTHGTPVAGLAAAVKGNGQGVVGVAPRAKILPVKVLSGNLGLEFSEAAVAFRYAAGLTSPNLWRGADLISLSLTFAPSMVMDSALTDVTTMGREGKGCPVFALSGNLGSGYFLYELADLPPGDYFFEWAYAKDEVMSGGEDTCWIADILFPDGTFETFDTSEVPEGWELAPFGEVPWQIEDDPSHAFGTGRYQARAGSIGDSEMSTIRSRTVSAPLGGDVSFFYWVSSEEGFDGIDFYVFDFVVNEYSGPFLGTSGVPEVASGVSYPGSHPATITVGASTDFDYRADYSQFGQGLDVLAPSDGGRSFITTTDLTGLAGFRAGDYAFDFGGTSAAVPLAAGVGALMISANPNLTAEEIRRWLRSASDRVGQVTYTNGFSPWYGYGRVNAEQAVTTALGPQFVKAVVDDEEAAFTYQLARLPSRGNVVFERSSDFQEWTPFRTNTVQEADAEFSEPLASDPQARFYRARLE